MISSERKEQIIQRLIPYSTPDDYIDGVYVYLNSNILYPIQLKSIDDFYGWMMRDDINADEIYEVQFKLDNNKLFNKTEKEINILLKDYLFKKDSV